MNIFRNIIGIITVALICWNISPTTIHAQSNTLLTNFDAEAMAETHLNNPKLIRKRAKWNLGREYVFESEGMNLHFTIGVHASAEQAEKVALEYLSDISIMMTSEIDIIQKPGDNFWCNTPYNNSSEVTNIVFTRKNALIILSSHNMLDILDLANKIDEGILQDYTYVSLSNTVKLPVIEVISPSENNNRIGINIEASDPNKEELEFQFRPGLTNPKGAPEGFYLLSEYAIEAADDQNNSKLKAVAINSSNVVSSILEFDISTILY